MQRLDFYFSVISPFTYIAGPRFGAFAAAHGLEVVWKPLDIMALFARTGGTPVGQRHPSRQAYRLADIARQAKRAGLPVNVTPAHFPTNAAPASYAIIAAQNAGGGDMFALVQSLLAACWAEEKNVADDAVIKAALEAAGFDPGLADSGLFTGAEVYGRNLEEAIAAGVFGVSQLGHRGWRGVLGPGPARRSGGSPRVGVVRPAVREPDAGFPTHVVRMGRGVRRALLIHCTLGHSGTWHGVQAGLLEKLSMTGFDRPSHGKSAAWSGEGGARGLHDLTTRIAAALIDKRADVIGHSYGATVALRLALDHPAKVRSLTLVEPPLFSLAADTPAFAAHAAAMAAFDAALAAGEPREAARRFTRR